MRINLVTPFSEKEAVKALGADDERCCGTGTCLIDASGRCWCGQQWDGKKMCTPTPCAATSPTHDAEPEPAANTTQP